MKEIKAIIQPFMLTKVVEALHQIEGLPGVTISEIKGFGRTKAKDAKDKITEGLLEFVQKIKLEIVVKDEMVEKVLETIQKNAHTGNPGDGKIFVYGVEEIVRIRTNEKGKEAI